MKLKQTPLTKDFATLVELDNGKANVRLSPELRQRVIQLMKRRGAVLFRRFNLDVDEFERFTNQFGSSEDGFHPKFSGALRFVGTTPHGYDFVERTALGAPPSNFWASPLNSRTQN